MVDLDNGEQVLQLGDKVHVRTEELAGNNLRKQRRSRVGTTVGVGVGATQTTPCFVGLAGLRWGGIVRFLLVGWGGVQG